VSKNHYTLHLVSHTHWDREWYLTFQQFRMRLVAVIDELLDILDNQPAYKYFMLDGQTIVLEDYLAIRPENASRLREFIRSGRILIGPWYVLPDEFLVSGEALIRNLLYGAKMAADFGPVMPVGYLPDQFGHISQMPQILNGFGIDTAVIWRGVGDADGNELESEFLWEAPDGSQVLALRLPADRVMGGDEGVHEQGESCLNEGYFNAANLPTDPQVAARRIERVAEQLGRYARSRHLLLMNGVDHARPQRDIPAIIDGVNKLLSCGHMVHSTLPLLFEGIRAAGPRLRTVGGEFRRRRNGDILFGTISARTYLKQENHFAQRDIERLAEPLATLAWTMGDDYPQVYLDEAWKLLLRNHPHDSICGCSIDPVHEEMMVRYASCRQITGELAQRALHYLFNRIDLSLLGEGDTALVVFNPAGRPRSEAVEAKLRFPHDAGAAAPAVYDTQGRQVPLEILSEERHQFELAPDDFLRWQDVDTFTVSFPAEDIPPLGYRCFVVRAADEPRAVEAPSSDRHLENEYLRVVANPDGSFDLLDKRTERLYERCNLLSDSADIGDFYNYSPPEEDRIVRGFDDATVMRISSNSMVIEGELLIPMAACDNRRRRTEETVRCGISETITLKGRRVEIRLTIDNRAKDHRLRALFPTGLQAVESRAAGQFDVVARPIGTLETGKWFEQPLPTHPQENFVDISDGSHGLALFSRGLVEYEVIEDPQIGTLALTLMRCVEGITRGGLRTTDRNQGDPIWCYSPEGQCLGSRTFEYAVCPHEGDWLAGDVLQEAEAYRLPCRGVQLARNDGGQLGAAESFLSVEPDFLELRTLKRSEDTASVVVRLVNPTDASGEARLLFRGGARKAARADLAENELAPLPVAADGAVVFPYARKEIITLKLMLDGSQGGE